MTEDTIVAIATPPGRGGVGIIRISGNEAYSLATSITKIKNLEPRYFKYCGFFDINKNVLDKGMVVFFKAPNSFTGEDVVELHTHGSPVVLDSIIKTLLDKGARLAQAGEFTKRAFLNDKIDLTQAEAIADLIDAQSESAARMALRSLSGLFSKKITDLNKNIINLRLFVEACIDFPEEEIDFLSDTKIKEGLQGIIQELELIRDTASSGAIMREGISIVIAGRPNAGKSTLINSLSGKEVAIVTEIAGTTRDVMREHVNIFGIPTHLVDTAGLHETEDVIEKEGIKRAWNEVKKADCVLLIFDGTEKDFSQSHSLSNEIKKALPRDVPIIPVINKIDLCERKFGDGYVAISAKSHEGITRLKEEIVKVIGYKPQEGMFLARRRHLKSLDKAYSLLCNGQEELEHHQAGELLAEDLRAAHNALCEITGEFTSDDLLGVIFSEFCIGK